MRAPHGALSLVPAARARRSVPGSLLSRSSALSTMTAIAVALAATRPAVAAPGGGTVISGSATINQSGAVTNIQQSTSRAIINWWSFSIAPNETVNFYQPGSTSVTLNRVIGNEASVIAGALNANGRIYIVNSNGILFTRGAQANVGGLVASTLDISDKDFLAGNNSFSGSSTASVVNQGAIRASNGGYVALLGRTVTNEGSISARLGSIALASGEKITLNLGADAPFDVTVDKGTLNALVENKGVIKANGGNVVLTAKAADAVLSAQVNNSGVISARTIADLTGGAPKAGKIKLLAIGGTTRVAGKLDASARKGGNGGVIETSGNKVVVASNAVITTKSATGKNGSWIIDPDGFTIAASGGDITGATLGNQLENTNVTIASTSGSGSTGNIDVNDTVSWASNSTLTLNATNSININQPIYATGDNAGVVLNFGNYAAAGTVTPSTDYTFGNAGSLTLAGANSTLSINGQGYTLIHSMTQLAKLSTPIYDGAGNIVLDAGGLGTFTTADGYYAIAQNLDASGTTYTVPAIVTLNGALAGLGHTINKFTYNNQTIDNNQGIGDGFIVNIGSTAVVRDLGLTNVDITAPNGVVGGLAASNGGAVSNVFVTGSIAAGSAGGLAYKNDGVIASAYTNLTSLTVTGANNGGLVGLNFGTIANSTANGTLILNAPTDGGANNAVQTGGFVGVNYGRISNSQANVNIAATNSPGLLGGFVGWNYSRGTITNSSSTGDIRVTNINTTIAGVGYGGFVGRNDGSIDSSTSSSNINVTTLFPNNDPTADPYATSQGVGGFVGANRKPGRISNSSSTGSVTGVGVNTDGIGGFFGTSPGTISNSYSGSPVSGPPGNLVGAFGGQNQRGTNSGNTYNTDTSGQTNAVGGGASGGISGTTTAPSGATVTANAGSDFGSASTAGQTAAARSLARAASDRQAARQFAANLAAAARQAAVQSANVSTTNAERNRRSQLPDDLSRASAARGGNFSGQGVDDNIKIDPSVLQTPQPPHATTPAAHSEDEPPRRRQIAVAHSAPKAHPHVRHEPDYGASIRGVDIDGKHYNLQDGGRPANAPAQPAH